MMSLHVLNDIVFLFPIGIIILLAAFYYVFITKFHAVKIQYTSTQRERNVVVMVDGFQMR